MHSRRWVTFFGNANSAKTKKRTSIEVLIAQLRAYKALDRGSVKHSIELFVNRWLMMWNLDPGLKKARSRVKVDLVRASLISSDK